MVQYTYLAYIQPLGDYKRIVLVRWAVILLGILSNMMGIFMASIAELVLFIDADNDDSSLISAAQAGELEYVVDMISADHLLGNGAGVGEIVLSCLSAETAVMINDIRRFSKPMSMLALLSAFGLSLTLGLCI
jgi:hypothetical protein